MTEWSDFYGAVVGASAALTGLIFVGVSISLTKILSSPGLADRALLSLLLLLNVLAVSLLFLVPGQTIRGLGVEVLLVGIVAWFSIFRLDLRTVQRTQREYKRQRLFNLLVDQTATICFIVTGVMMATRGEIGEYWIVPAILVSITKAVLDGWVLLVEINR